MANQNVGQIAIAGGVVAEGTTRTPFHALGTVSGLTDVFILRFGRLSDGRTSARCSESGDTVREASRRPHPSRYLTA